MVTARLSWLTQTITGSGNASTEQPSLALVPVLTLTTASSTATVGGSVMERGDLWLPVKILPNKGVTSITSSEDVKRKIETKKLLTCDLQYDPAADGRRDPVGCYTEVGPAVPPGHGGQAHHLALHRWRVPVRPDH